MAPPATIRRKSADSDGRARIGGSRGPIAPPPTGSSDPACRRSRYTPRAPAVLL
jgi:hypothetical protein